MFPSRRSLVCAVLFCTAILQSLASGLLGTDSDPAAADYAGRKGVTLFVSKLGDDSDGSSWAKAFRTIQAALAAVPDDKGGHRVLVRPDTYAEANLYPAFKGAAGSYNLLLGDVDGALGSGATGWVVIDSSDTEKGFKSVDWWSTMRAGPTPGPASSGPRPPFSGSHSDRWIFRNLYATGGDAGLFWDLTDQSGAGFTVVVEDCVGIGRAFGGGFAYPMVRKGEPTVFRRTYLMSLDWWGDAGALAVGGRDASAPDCPHGILEDCTLVAPDNAVQVCYPSLHVRLEFKDCRLIVLNFSQPRGTPSSGIFCCDKPGNHLHLDLQDCTLMGYKVFGTGNGVGKISCTTKGKVAAYVQYEQSVPDGFQRLALWPVDAFDAIGPPKPGQKRLAVGAAKQ